MKRWDSIAAIAGVLIVFVFFVQRLFEVRASWADFHTLGPDLLSISLFVLMNAAILLVILIIPGAAYLLWTTTRRKLGKGRRDEHQDEFAVRLRRVAEIAVLSVVTALGVAGISKMRSPGWGIAMTLGFWSGAHHLDLNLGLMILLAIGVDSTICFAVLWGGYVLLRRFRRRNHPQGSNQGRNE